MNNFLFLTGELIGGWGWVGGWRPFGKHWGSECPRHAPWGRSQLAKLNHTWRKLSRQNWTCAHPCTSSPECNINETCDNSTNLESIMNSQLWQSGFWHLPLEQSHQDDSNDIPQPMCESQVKFLFLFSGLTWISYSLGRSTWNSQKYCGVSLEWSCQARPCDSAQSFADWVWPWS